MTSSRDLAALPAPLVQHFASVIPLELRVAQVLLPTLVALFMLGILGWWLIWLVRRNRGKSRAASAARVSLIYWLTAPALLTTLYVLDSRALVESSVAPPDAMPIRVTDSGGSWRFRYPNDKVSNHRLVVAEDRAVQLILTTSGGVRDFCLPAYDRRVRAVVGRYATLWFRPGPRGDSAIDCSASGRWFFLSSHRRNAPTGAERLSVLAPAAFDAWMSDKSDSGAEERGGQ